MSRPAVRLPSMEGLRAFEAVARLGSLERAAQELNVTPSAVSKRLSTLEELLGEKLLMRSGSSVALTREGSEYLLQVGCVLRALLSMPQHRGAAKRSSKLRVTSPPTFARQVLVPHLHSFTFAHPCIKLEITSSPAIPDSPSTDADVEIRYGNAALHHGIQLMQDVATPMASPLFIQSAPTLSRPADLAKVPLLRSPLEQWVAWFRAAGLEWDNPVEGVSLGDFGLMIEAAVAGQGVALCRPSLVMDWMTRGELVPLFPVLAHPTNQYYVLPISQDEPAIAFVRWLHGLCDDVAERSTHVLRQLLQQRLPLRDGAAG